MSSFIQWSQPVLLPQSIEWIYVSVSFPRDYFQTILREENVMFLAPREKSKSTKSAGIWNSPVYQSMCARSEYSIY